MCKVSQTILMLFVGLVIWLSILVKKNIRYKKENKRINLYLEKQEQYIKNILEKENYAKGFRHDIKNHINMLSQYINNLDIGGAKKYILKINEITEYAKIESYTGIIPVDAVLSEIFRKMDDNIKLRREGSISNEQKLDSFDMCVLFTNIISNAIEACNKCTDEKYIRVKIYQYHNVIKIYEENTYDGNIKIDKSGKLINSKADKNNHGLGSKNIKNIVEKYDGIVQIIFDERVFKLNITI